MFHLSTRKSGHPALCPRSWAGLPANQVRGQVIPYLQSLLTTWWDQMGHGAPDVDPTAVPKVSLLPTAGDQAHWAQQQVVIWSTPKLLNLARCWAAGQNSPMMRETVLGKMTMPKKRVGLRPRVMDRWHLMVKKGRTALILKTPSPALARSLVDMRTQTQSLTPGRKSSPLAKVVPKKPQGGQPP